jgi:hypothetical protein
MKKFKYFLGLGVVFVIASVIYAQTTGSNGNLISLWNGSKPVVALSDSLGNLQVGIVTVDPCQSPGVTKSSFAISINSAGTTTSLVPTSGTTKIFFCGASLTLNQTVTTADTFQLEYGTGAACVTTQSVQTGAYGTGSVTAGDDILITIPEFQPSAAGAALCAVTTGAAVNANGVGYFVQQ